ncbi:hypothetical protein PABG_03899 [Paracoccidioides brasiliensis Pb03]|uniref:DUF8032 domain-containing protein n=1 Tax=Paracoccidioides brasiliensis (strain Pb18) TaxID=502780 RepID=C1GJB3_PARBD|nr:uncharacterized protein PADG_07349 [Paracoccidioides brasiliensis Pb18]EEH21683.2 hypothetical protein PABG_03899 [Paracoccidioides brasiliensis Pb03]EEH42529.2 hypothetical protein PADG_07349 [Paracoccidioides brasiliensis Pb18]
MAATAQMQRPYPPIYHTPQSNSPASVPSPQSHDPHGRTLYGQPPQMAQGMYGYPQFPPMNPIHSGPYGPHPAHPHAQLTSQPQPLLAGHQGSPGQLQHQHQQTQQHPVAITSSPRMKYDPTPQQPTPPQRTPLNSSHLPPPVSGGTVHSGPGGSNTSAAPGPIPATTPLVVRQDQNGVQWIAFEYSRDRVKMEYTIRCDVENINIENLSQEFKTENCVYPRACCSKDQYRGNRLVYETECNAVGWALAELNSCLRGKRGLIQRAVDSWRNSNQDPRLRSRRVRRMAKINNRKSVSSQHPNHLAGPPSAVGVPGSAGLAPTGSLGIGGPQLHHHHAHPSESGASQSGEDVSGKPEYSSSTHRPSPPQNAYATSAPFTADNRPAQIFHGYPKYPSQASSNNPTGPSMPPPLRETGLDHLGRHSIVATSHSRGESDERNPDNAALFGDLPEGSRRKFILVEDPQRGCRVRVKVMLDQVDMKEIPDSYRKSNSVFPRTYFPVQSPFGRGNRGGRFIDDVGGYHGESDDDVEATVGRTLVPVPMPDGEANLAVPKIARRKRDKEVMLNDLGYRMSWGQSRVFAGRTLFLQRSLDAYRNKMRSTMTTTGQELTSVAPHFETRVGKRKWLERNRRSRAARATSGGFSGPSTPAVATLSSTRNAEEVVG